MLSPKRIRKRRYDLVADEISYREAVGLKPQIANKTKKIRVEKIIQKSETTKKSHAAELQNEINSIENVALLNLAPYKDHLNFFVSHKVIAKINSFASENSSASENSIKRREEQPAAIAVVTMRDYQLEGVKEDIRILCIL